VKKRTGKLVPVDVGAGDALKEVIPLAKLRFCRLSRKDGTACDLEKSVEENGLRDGDTVTSEGEAIFPHLHFRRPDGKEFRVEGENLLHRKISSIKEVEVAPRTKGDPGSMSLFIGCIELDEDKTLFDYNVEYGESLTVKVQGEA